MMDFGVGKMFSVGLTLRKRPLFSLGLNVRQEGRQPFCSWLYFQQLKDNLPILGQCFQFLQASHEELLLFLLLAQCQLSLIQSLLTGRLRLTDDQTFDLSLYPEIL